MHMCAWGKADYCVFESELPRSLTIRGGGMILVMHSFIPDITLLKTDIMTSVSIDSI